jgi:Uma2 family endonuclease
MTPEIQALVSIDEFWRLPRRFPRVELVAGQIVEMIPPGTEHGLVVSRLDRILGPQIEERGLGMVLVETGYILGDKPPFVRSPDVSIVLRNRIPEPRPTKFFPGPPDVAVEVLSPEDRQSEVAAKVAEYLRSGVQTVWVVDPGARTLTVHGHDGAVRYAHHETVRGTLPLPELEVELAKLFA